MPLQLCKQTRGRWPQAKDNGEEGGCWGAAQAGRVEEGQVEQEAQSREARPFHFFPCRGNTSDSNVSTPSSLPCPGVFGKWHRPANAEVTFCPPQVWSQLEDGLFWSGLVLTASNN